MLPVSSSQTKPQLFWFSKSETKDARCKYHSSITQLLAGTGAIDLKQLDEVDEQLVPEVWLVKVGGVLGPWQNLRQR